MNDSPKKQEWSGSWKQFKGRVQEIWGELTDDELDKYEGKREQLEGYLEEKTGEQRQKIRKQIDRISEEVKYSM
jgi:uncharacterized protein YjbJ (UPF0337 family)